MKRATDEETVDVLVLISAALFIRGPFCACDRWPL